MAKEKAPIGVVRISISLGEFVVHPVITAPVVNVLLQGNCLSNDNQQAKGKVGFKGSVAVVPSYGKCEISRLLKKS